MYIYNLEGIPDSGAPEFRHESFLGLWIEDNTSFLFFSSCADTLVERIISKQTGIALIERYEMTEEQWHGEKIAPYHIENICICPPWDQPAGFDIGVNKILLDPGVVFGTGKHQTTEDCLTLLFRLCRKERIRHVLDIGTGTGILSLAAALSGASKVFACDYNHLAVETTLRNVRLNRMEKRVLPFQAKGEEIVSMPGDLLVANIHYDVMRHIINSPGFLTKRWFILSGLLNSETRKILSHLKEKPVRIIERRCPDGIWNTIFGQSCIKG